MKTLSGGFAISGVSAVFPKEVTIVPLHKRDRGRRGAGYATEPFVVLVLRCENLKRMSTDAERDLLPMASGCLVCL